MKFKKALGIDIGGTKIYYSLINNEGKIISEVQKISTPKTKIEIQDTLSELIKGFNEIDFIAIATAGTVNCQNTEVIGSTANLPLGYKNIEFQELSDKKVIIENDANCAAYAEYKIGASKDMQNSLTVTLGTGVGAGIILNGKLFKGKNGAAGEMHFPLSRKKERKCTCGQYDCYEAYASGNGLRKTAIDVTHIEDITTYDIMAGVKDADSNSLLAVKIWQDDVALGLLGLANIFDPDCIVLSGSMEEFIDTNYVEKYINSKLVTTPTKVFHAKCKNYSGMIGAVLLGYDKL